MIDDRRFTLSMEGDGIILESPGLAATSLSLVEWAGVRAGLDALAKFRQPQKIKAHVDRGTPDAPNNGQAWTDELDQALCQAWHAGEGLAAIARRFGRTTGSIASRLAKLDCVTDLDEARSRP